MNLYKIIDALHEAKTADTVFLALNHVPTSNLKDMKKNDTLHLKPPQKRTRRLALMRKEFDHLPDKITITWTVEAIKDRDDERDELTRNDCRQILDIMFRHHDANIGINWEIIDLEIENFYKEKELA